MNTPDKMQQETSQFQVEQAIFTSATSAKSEGYHLVAVSPGVAEADRRELSIWGPSHDSLLEAGHGALSVNFHVLPSGSFCVSQTTLEGAEYSGRGPQVYTHSLIVPPIVMDQFGNNPFVLLREATAAGHVRIYSEPPERLKQFSVQGGFPAVDEELLAQLVGKFGALRLACLIDAILSSRCVGIVSEEGGPRLISGLINCLPLEIRPTISFSTALKHSPRRPYRVICVSSSEKEQRRLVRQYEVDLFHVDQYPEEGPEHPWAKLVLERFENCDFAQFSRELNRPRPRLKLEDVATLADELLSGTESDHYAAPTEQSETEQSETEPTEAAEVERSTEDDSRAAAEPVDTSEALEPASDDKQENQTAAEPQQVDSPQSEVGTATHPSESPAVDPFAELESAFADETDEAFIAVANDAADPLAELIEEEQFAPESEFETNHPNSTSNSGEPMSQQTPSTPAFQEETASSGGDDFASAGSRKEPKPAFQLSRQCPEAAARLMRLEATIFEAMTGDESAQSQLDPLWTEVQEKLGQDLQQRCREEFLHYAIHMWQHFSSDFDRNPLQAVAALDVVCRLFETPSAALQPVNA